MINRRTAIRALTLGGGASLAASADPLSAAFLLERGSAFAPVARGTAPVKIRDIKTILTAPNGIRLVVVKVETSEPGLVRLGLRDLHPAGAGRRRRRSRST